MKQLAIILVLIAFAFSSSGVFADDAVSPQTEVQIDKGLAWLAKQQKPDGSFPSDYNGTAITSLSVMAFLSRGHVPGEGLYGEQINKAIDYVMSSQQETGVLAPGYDKTMYDHGISTVMLCEVYGMVDDQRRAKLDKVIAKAVKLILDAQKIPQGIWAGGWRYQPGSQDADISVTGWQLMALRGAAACGATVPKSAIDAGIAYIKRSAVGGGGFSYQPNGGASVSSTGTGILAMSLLGQHGPTAAPEAAAGGDYLLKNIQGWPPQDFQYYSIYYCSQAVNQLGGKYWDTFYPLLREKLLKQQAEAGNWHNGGGNEQQAGHCYSTAMAVLALCVPYHYLPLYQK